MKSNRDLTSEIDRLEKYVKTLEKISKKYDINVKSDFIKIYDLIQELRNRNQINNENTNYDDIINEIKLFLILLKTIYARICYQNTNLISLKDFLIDYLRKLINN